MSQVTIAGNSGAISAFKPPGGTWSLPTVVRDAAVSRPLIATDAAFRTHVAWLGSGNGDPLNYALSSMGGPWTVALSVDNPPLIGPAGFELATDQAGNPQALITIVTGGAFLRSNGTTWLQQPLPAAVSRGAGLVSDATGRTLLVYRTNTNRLESVVVGADGTLGPAEPIASVALDNGTSLAVGNDTFVVLFSNGAGVFLATKAGAAAWSIETLSATGTLACGAGCLVADGLGRLHTLIAEAGTVRYAHTDAANQWQSEPADLGGTIASLYMDAFGVLHAFVRPANSTSVQHVVRCPLADAGALRAVVPTAGTWQELPSAPRPAPRYGGQGLVYDSSQREMVLFGGHDLGVGQAPPETWTFPANGTAWIRKAPTTAPNPGAREVHGMAYDSARSRVVLMGGGFNADVWEWNGATATWSSRAGTSPPAGLVPTSQTGPVTRLAYDSARSKMVVLIAGTCPGACWGLWDWDPGTGAFTARTSVDPKPVTVTSIAYDALSGLVIANGAGATWEWNPGTGSWTDRTGGAAGPSAGELVSGANGRFVIYDGTATWEWSRSTAIWRQRTLTQVGPASRRSAMVAYHPERQTVWLFGGKGLASSYYLPQISPRPSPDGVFDTTFEWHGAPSAP